MSVTAVAGGARPIIQRLGEEGRSMPDGLEFVADGMAPESGRGLLLAAWREVRRSRQVAGRDDLL